MYSSIKTKVTKKKKKDFQNTLYLNSFKDRHIETCDLCSQKMRDAHESARCFVVVFGAVVSAFPAFYSRHFHGLFILVVLLTQCPPQQSLPSFIDMSEEKLTGQKGKNAFLFHGQIAPHGVGAGINSNTCKKKKKTVWKSGTSKVAWRQEISRV